MAEIKKVVIPKESLPPLNGDTEKYIVRYRIISEDRNRSSSWSPQYFVSPNEIIVEENTGIEQIQIIGSLLSLVWELPSTDTTQKYDVFIAWGTSEGSVGLTSYVGTVSGNYINIPVPVTAVSLKARIQAMSLPRKITDRLLVAETSVLNVADIVV